VLPGSLRGPYLRRRRGVEKKNGIAGGLSDYLSPYVYILLSSFRILLCARGRDERHRDEFINPSGDVIWHADRPAARIIHNTRAHNR